MAAQVHQDVLLRQIQAFFEAVGKRMSKHPGQPDRSILEQQIHSSFGQDLSELLAFNQADWEQWLNERPWSSAYADQFIALLMSSDLSKRERPSVSHLINAANRKYDMASMHRLQWSEQLRNSHSEDGQS